MMVEQQLRPRGISDPRVLEAMGQTPRERFVPEAQRPFAYQDCPLGIGSGQTISQPYMVALMTESLNLTGDDRVLEVGTGSGYQAAVLARLAGWVYTVERVPELAESARRLLEELGVANASFRVGDGTLGWPEEAPFDRIMVTAGAPHTPRRLLEQLGPGGQMVAPVGPGHVQTLTRFRRDEEGRESEEAICGCMFVRLIGEDGW